MDSNEERDRRVCAIGSTPRGEARVCNQAFHGSSAMVECIGCGQDFSVKGFTYHIHTISHQPCISAYEEEVRQVVVSLQDISDGMDGQLNEDFITPAFNDDAFIWEDDDWDIKESDTEDDMEDVDITGELQELPNQPDEGTVPKQPQANRQATLVTHPIADKDWSIEEYPLASTGVPLAAKNCLSTGDEKSQSNMSADELYGPFQSRLDWELVQWAKYETISSNALTQLLSINGISCLISY